MERRSEDLADDPDLREEFVAQESYDEFIERKIAEIEEEDAFLAQELREDTQHLHAAFQYWNFLWRTEVVNPTTSINELYYLAGYTEKPRRVAAIGQFHAQLRERAQELGVFEIAPVEGIEEFNLEGEQ